MEDSMQQIAIGSPGLYEIFVRRQAVTYCLNTSGSSTRSSLEGYMLDRSTRAATPCSHDLPLQMRDRHTPAPNHPRLGNSRGVAIEWRWSDADYLIARPKKLGSQPPSGSYVGVM
jgi:hypothetical protein